MSKRSMFINIIIGSLLYHLLKLAVVGWFDFEEFFSAIYWVGIGLAAVHYFGKEGEVSQ